MYKKLVFIFTISSLLLINENLISKDKEDKVREKNETFQQEKQNIKESDHFSDDRRGSHAEQRDTRQNFRTQQREVKQESYFKQSDKIQDSPSEQHDIKQDFRRQQRENYQETRSRQPEQQQNIIQESRQENRSDYDQDIKEHYEESEPTRSWKDRFKNFFNGSEKNNQFDAKGDRNHDASEGRFSRENLRQKESRWRDHASSFRRGFSTHKKRYHIFDDYYWNRFRSHYDDWHFNNQFSWYVAPSWSRVIVWLPWGWDTPMDYYYGEDGSVYYSSNVDDPYFISVESNNNYDIDAIDLANSKPYISEDQNDWISLGTFGIFNNEDTSQIPQEYLSIAISKDGAVSGAYVNVNDNRPIQIKGAVDKRSQRIAWKFVEQDWPVMETGLYNLTKKESTLLVYFSRFKKESRVIAQIEE